MTTGHIETQKTTAESQPLLSIITINWNNAAGLKRTLCCLASQSYRSYEHIVVDGASTDGSVAVITESEFKVDCWVSEPDAGIYDAMNKGIRLAKGRYVLFLNSGDSLVDDFSLTMAAGMMDDTDLQSFNLLVRGHSDFNGGAEYIRHSPDRINFSFMAIHSLPHPATFIRARLFEEYGLYDSSLRICADWKQFILWTCKYGCSYKHHAATLSVFYQDGISSDPCNFELQASERTAVLRVEFPAFLDDLESLVKWKTAQETLNALRCSRWIRFLQSLGLLWKF